MGHGELLRSEASLQCDANRERGDPDPLRVFYFETIEWHGVLPLVVAAWGVGLGL